MKSRGLVVTMILTLAFGLGGLVLYQMRSARPYISLPGVYECDSFGLPDSTYNKIRIEQDFRVIGEGKPGTFEAGTLNQKNATQGKLDIAMPLVHSPKFDYDPFTPMIFEKRGSTLRVQLKGNEGPLAISCSEIR